MQTLRNSTERLQVIGWDGADAGGGGENRDE